MNFLKSIVLFLTLILMLATISAQESEPIDDKSSEEESEEWSNEQTTDEMKSSKAMESSTEAIKAVESEDKTETIAIVYEEIDTNAETSTTTPVLSTETEESITSQYNGFDLNETSATRFGFSCYNRSFGQYADVATDCHLFHLCYPFFNSTTDELLYQRITFECDNDSVFDQKRFICAENSTIGHKCSDSEDLYERSNQEYLIRVFSQSVSPVDEVKGVSPVDEGNDEQSGAETPNGSPGWFNWFSRLYN